MNAKSLKYYLVGGVLLSLPVLVQAKEGVNKDPYFLSNFLENGFLLFGAFIVFATIAFLFYFMMSWMEVQKREMLKEQGLYVPEVKIKQASLFSRLYTWATDAVPIEKEADVMLDHNYDGIRELDNSLPPWWVAMFYVTIFIGSAYFLYYHYLDLGYSSGEEYAIEMAYAERQMAAVLEKQANAVNESNVEMLTDAAMLAAGKDIFIASCAACHGQLGEGLVGPNMVDKYWVHGGDIKSVFKTIKYGVPEKGMISWKTQMSAASMHQVASYILTLQGTDPPNQKAAEGALYEAEQ